MLLASVCAKRAAGRGADVREALPASAAVRLLPPPSTPSNTDTPSYPSLPRPKKQEDEVREYVRLQVRREKERVRGSDMRERSYHPKESLQK